MAAMPHAEYRQSGVKHNAASWPRRRYASRYGRIAFNSLPLSRDISRRRYALSTCWHGVENATLCCRWPLNSTSVPFRFSFCITSVPPTCQHNNTHTLMTGRCPLPPQRSHCASRHVLSPDAFTATPRAAQNTAATFAGQRRHSAAGSTAHLA